MADTNILDEKKTSVKTKPANKVKLEEKPLSASSIRGRPAQYGQIGLATSYISTGENFVPVKRPHHYQLAAWDNARLKEPIIKNGIEKLTLYICSKIGRYHHPNPMIEEFVNVNLENRIHLWIQEIAQSAYWSGFGVSEILWNKKPGPDGFRQIWIEDIVNYHPTQIEFRLNDYSRLTHGEKTSYSQLHSGIWVPAPNTLQKNRRPSNNYTGGMLRLPKSKVMHVAFGGSHNNPWGHSQLESVLDYHLFKEAFRDMMAIALDRYGTPLLYAIVPPQLTSEVVEEPDGTQRNKTYRESVAEVISSAKGNQGIVLEQLSKEYPVSIGSLTTSNNYADAFTQAIDFCDHNMQVGMGIPNLIMRDERSGLGNGQSSENQVEMFNMLISHYFKIVTNAFVNQVVRQLIAYNFDADSVKNISQPGYISELPLRPTEIETLTAAIEKMTMLGYVNPSDQEDYNHVRSMFKLANRPVDKFAKDMVKVHTEATDQAIAKDGLNVKREDIASKERMNKMKVKEAAKKPAPTRPASIATPAPGGNN